MQHSQAQLIYIRITQWKLQLYVSFSQLHISQILDHLHISLILEPMTTRSYRHLEQFCMIQQTQIYTQLKDKNTPGKIYSKSPCCIRSSTQRSFSVPNIIVYKSVIIKQLTRLADQFHISTIQRNCIPAQLHQRLNQRFCCPETQLGCSLAITLDVDGTEMEKKNVTI